MSSPQGSVKQRSKRGGTPAPDAVAAANGKAQEVVSSVKKTAETQAGSDWDYKLAFVLTTVLAFLTRFWGITHPDQVVFDEVHFGKVGADQRA